jgi:alpha-L-rhamnosidase
MTTITNLICEYRTNPLGIDVLRPRLSWQMQTTRQGARQVAYRIQIASHPDLLAASAKVDLWDSGRVDSDQSIHVSYAGPPLASRQRVYWQVIVWDETGQSTESDAAWFEMGLLDRGDWQAQWIGGDLVGGPRSPIPAPYVRKPFHLSGEVQDARLYITALGVYECSINGQIIGDDVLSPGWTEFDTRIRFRAYDVTDELHGGANVIGAVLGDGWAVGHLSSNNRQLYADRPRLLAQLEITLSGGSQECIVTDGSWTYHYGAVLDNDLIMGESYDARLEMPGWDAPGFDDHHWRSVLVFEDTGAALVAYNGPTIKRFEELQPVMDPVIPTRHRRWVFDLGQNMVGRVRLKASAPAGTTAILRFAEALNPDGTIYTTNLRTARVTDHYTFKGEGEEVWEPKFTFHGFRYVEVRGLPGELTRDTITGIVLYSDMAKTGQFECSDPTINQLQQNILWGQKGNFLDVPTDCPQRDERMGWTGDIQVFAQTAAFNMNVAGFMTKWAQDLADAQSEDGSVPMVVPNLRRPTDGGPAWADAAIICPWTIYQCYGDERILAENYDVMTQFMDFILAGSPDYIRCAPDYDGWLGFGDWLSINADTPRDLIGTAFLAYDAHLMAEIAAVLGKPDETARYQLLFNDVKSSFAERFLPGSQASLDPAQAAIIKEKIAHAEATSRGNLEAVDYGPVESEVFNTNLFEPTQTAYVLALHFNLLPDDLRPLAVAELVADIERRDMHLSTGFVGSPYLPHVLSNGDRLDTAYDLLHQKTWPSWLYAVTQGATTIWERWDGWTEENGFQDPNMNSFNHYAYGAIGAWLYENVAGLKFEQPGYKHFVVQPQPGGGLTQAKARLDCMYGEISAAWRLIDDCFEMMVQVPPNTGATVHLPMQGGQTVDLNGSHVQGMVHELAAGYYQFVVSE